MKKMLFVVVALGLSTVFAKEEKSVDRKPNQEALFSCKLSLDSGKTFLKFNDINKDCDLSTACFSRQELNVKGYSASYDIMRAEHVVRIFKGKKEVAITQTYASPISSLSVNGSIIVQCGE